MYVCMHACTCPYMPTGAQLNPIAGSLRVNSWTPSLHPSETLQKLGFQGLALSPKTTQDIWKSYVWSFFLRFLMKWGFSGCSPGVGVRPSAHRLYKIFRFLSGLLLLFKFHIFLFFVILLPPLSSSSFFLLLPFPFSFFLLHLILHIFISFINFFLLSLCPSSC